MLGTAEGGRTAARTVPGGVPHDMAVPGMLDRTIAGSLRFLPRGMVRRVAGRYIAGLPVAFSGLFSRNSADQAPLKFRQGTKDVKDELPAAGGRVDRFLEAAEPDLPRLQSGDRLDRVLERAPQPVELPDD